MRYHLLCPPFTQSDSDSDNNYCIIDQILVRLYFSVSAFSYISSWINDIYGGNQNVVDSILRMYLR